MKVPIENIIALLVFIITVSLTIWVIVPHHKKRKKDKYCNIDIKSNHDEWFENYIFNLKKQYFVLNPKNWTFFD